jgi:2-polyprenyl-3-methyl-5-hydroxy-6-metoxy-1,4-benzoquinol methylase
VRVTAARRIVDIGCGNGALCRELSSCGYQVVGCEPSADALRLAQRAARDLAFHSLGVEGDPSALGNDSLDVAIAAEVIEHLVKPRDLLRFARQLLRPGDHLIISTPYHGYLKNLVLALRDKWHAHLNPFWGWRHQVLVAQDTFSIVERNRFQRRSVHRSGSVTFSL